MASGAAGPSSSGSGQGKQFRRNFTEISEISLLSVRVRLGAAAPAAAAARRPLRPGPVVCRCYGVVTAVAANVLSAVYSFRGGADIIGGVFRCYAVVFSIFVAVLETEWAPIMRLWKIFEYLPARGLLQIFVAIMTKAYPNVERNELILLQEIATYMLLACGAVYTIAGILCLGVLKRSRQHKATSQEQAVKDLEELEKRKEELESLLTAERPDTA